MVGKKKQPGLYSHPKAKKRMKRPEQLLQIAIFNFLRPLMQYQQCREFIAFHVPQGGFRTDYEGMIFKSMGVMPGVADICILFPARYESNLPPTRMITDIKPPRVVFVELKAGSKGKLSGPQESFQKLCGEYGVPHYLLAAEDEKDAVSQMRAILQGYGVEC